MRTYRTLAALACTALVGTALVGVAACGPLDREPENAGGASAKGKDGGCPPPPEPTYQSMVLGTIGKYHLAESRYPLSRIGDVVSAFKPDLVLLAVRVDPYREGHLEEASFEMTYANFVAKERGIAVEPIDWFRWEDLGAAPPSVEPWDAREVLARESAVLREPRLLTFEQANAPDFAVRVLGAQNAEVRYRTGNGVAARRAAWMSAQAERAITRHQRPKRVLAVVDVFDRPALDLHLHGQGYANQEPVLLLEKAKEVMMGDVPPEVVTEFRAELGRARLAEKDAKGPTAAFWAERAKVLELAVEKKGGCCVTQSALAAPEPPANEK